jgi:hypothetical protein
VPNDPVVREAVPPSSAIRPRIDRATPSLHSLVQPARGDPAALVAHRDLHAVVEGLDEHPDGSVRTDVSRHVGQALPHGGDHLAGPRPAEQHLLRRSGDPHGVFALEGGQRRHQVLGNLRGSPGERVLLPDQGSQGTLLLARQPAELGRLTAELTTATLDQREHLEYAVVDGSGEAVSLCRGRCRPLRDLPLGGQLLEHAAHEADDRAADHEQEDVAVVGLGHVIAHAEVGHRQQGPGDEPAEPPPVDRPGEEGPHHPEPRDGGAELLPLDEGGGEERSHRDRQVGHEQCGYSPTVVGVGPDREHRPRRHPDDHDHPAAGVAEVVRAVDVEPDRVDQRHDPDDGERPEEPVLNGESSRRGAGRGQDACFCSAAGVSLAEAPFLASSLARLAYMSTYSWPESRMISYMISSVIDRRM